MDLNNNVSFEKLTTKLDKNPFFTISNSLVIFHFNGEEIKFDLNLISNVKIVKKRVFLINVLLTAFGLFFYLFIVEFFSIYLGLVFTPIIVLTIVLASFSIKKFSYKLLIDNEHVGFKVLKVSEKNLVYAQYFILIYKKNKMKNRARIHQPGL